MKKTIATLAILATSNAMAFMPPHGGINPVITKVCLGVVAHQQADGQEVRYATCDETDNNLQLKRELLDNECAAGQVALTIRGDSPIKSCLPPGVVQL